VCQNFDMEQRAVIECYFKLGKTATELYQELKECTTKVQGFRWFAPGKVAGG
jgi:hypothetical protein